MKILFFIPDSFPHNTSLQGGKLLKSRMTVVKVTCEKYVILAPIGSDLLLNLLTLLHTRRRDMRKTWRSKNKRNKAACKKRGAACIKVPSTETESCTLLGALLKSFLAETRQLKNFWPTLASKKCQLLTVKSCQEFSLTGGKVALSDSFLANAMFLPKS